MLILLFVTTITTSTSIPTPLLSILLKRRADQLQITNVVLHFATTRRNSAAAGGLLLPSPSLDRSRPTVVAAATVQIGQRGSLDEQTPLYLVARPIEGWRRRQRTDLAVARRFRCAIVRRLGSCRVFFGAADGLSCTCVCTEGEDEDHDDRQVVLSWSLFEVESFYGGLIEHETPDTTHLDPFRNEPLHLFLLPPVPVPKPLEHAPPQTFQLPFRLPLQLLGVQRITLRLALPQERSVRIDVIFFVRGRRKGGTTELHRLFPPHPFRGQDRTFGGFALDGCECSGVEEGCVGVGRWSGGGEGLCSAGAVGGMIVGVRWTVCRSCVVVVGTTAMIVP